MWRHPARNRPHSGRALLVHQLQRGSGGEGLLATFEARTRKIYHGSTRPRLTVRRGLIWGPSRLFATWHPRIRAAHTHMAQMEMRLTVACHPPSVRLNLKAGTVSVIPQGLSTVDSTLCMGVTPVGTRSAMTSVDAQLSRPRTFLQKPSRGFSSNVRNA